MNPDTKFEIKRIIGLAALVGLGIGGNELLYRTKDPAPIVSITNPVLVDRGEGRYNILTCEEGVLNYELPNYPDGSRVGSSISQDRVEVQYDNVPSQRPRLVVERGAWYNPSATLHLRPEETMPRYQSYGEGGARAYNVTGKYPCPTEQWRD